MEWWGWAILGIACMVIEVHLTQDFTLFCVGVAAFVVTAVAAFAVDLPFWSHWLLFSALAVVVLLTVRKPSLGRLRPDRGRDADFDYLLGEVATPSEDLAGQGRPAAERMDCRASRPLRTHVIGRPADPDALCGRHPRRNRLARAGRYDCRTGLHHERQRPRPRRRYSVLQDRRPRTRDVWYLEPALRNRATRADYAPK